MEVTFDELAACMRYMRVEDTEEEPAVLAVLLSAREYLAGAGVAVPAAGSSRRSLYDTAAHALALDYYEQRGGVLERASVTDNPAFRRTLNQLKLTEPPVSELDTGKEGV